MSRNECRNFLNKGFNDFKFCILVWGKWERGHFCAGKNFIRLIIYRYETALKMSGFFYESVLKYFKKNFYSVEENWGGGSISLEVMGRKLADLLMISVVSYE